MRILLLATAFNSLTQRIFVELGDLGHDVGCSVVADGDQMRAAVDAFGPELVVAPYLKTAIPEDIWLTRTCLIIHPGIRGDRGPSSLDWAILRGLPRWGVTVLQAADEFDAGDIWAHHEFPMGDRSKSALYRYEVADAAVEALLEAMARLRSEAFVPEPLDYARPEIEGRLERPCRQADRAIDWSAPTAVVLRHLRCSDSTPGVLDSLFGRQYYLFGSHEEQLLRGQPGDVIARRDGAICRATGDGAVWISHLKQAESGDEAAIKLPAAMLLAGELTDVPDLPLAPDEIVETSTYREIWYEERADVGYLHFEFYNGAMSTQQCIRLRQAYKLARRRPTKVIVLMGGSDLWSNGIDLNVIEAADEPHTESWSNIHAMDDLVHEILDTDSHVVISALAGNAGAGGVPLALAADEVCARPGVVLNPHYKGMELFGSEYWTYLFPRRVGQERTVELTETCMPISVRQAKAIGLIDHTFGHDTPRFREQVQRLAEGIAHGDDLDERLRRKRASRHHDESIRPLNCYRYEELARMRQDFSGPGYERARRAFVHKRPLEPFTHPSAVGPVIAAGSQQLEVTRPVTVGQLISQPPERCPGALKTTRRYLP
ncbi:MAG: putative two-component system protein hydrogenase maturation factor HypX/HoxX [Thermoleophilaceae bacterium]|nr:putative two-component system protein hydrogenase maturation factor HypX/HoxX [Thermoleophilaceae bacterium]